MENIDYKKLKYLNFGFELAFALKEQGKDSKAKEIYEEYLEAHPNSDAVLNNLGVIYENEGDFEKALDYYEKSESLSPSKVSANNILRSKELIEQRKKEKEEISSFSFSISLILFSILKFFLYTLALVS